MEYENVPIPNTPIPNASIPHAPLESTYTPPKNTSFKTGWHVLLVIFAAPIGLPLIIAFAATALALLISLTAVLFALFVSGVALIVAGGVSLLSVIFVMMTDVGFGIQLAGMGLVMLGLGILFFKNTATVLRGFPKVAGLLSGKIARRTNHADESITQ